MSTKPPRIPALKPSTIQPARSSRRLSSSQMIGGRGQHPHLGSGMSENAAEVQCRIEQDDLASGCFGWFSDLVTGRLDRLLDTGSRHLLQKKGLLDYERLGI